MRNSNAVPASEGYAVRDFLSGRAGSLDMELYEMDADGHAILAQFKKEVEMLSRLSGHESFRTDIQLNGQLFNTYETGDWTIKERVMPIYGSNSDRTGFCDFVLEHQTGWKLTFAENVKAEKGRNYQIEIMSPDGSHEYFSATADNHMHIARFIEECQDIHTIRECSGREPARIYIRVKDIPLNTNRAITSPGF